MITYLHWVHGTVIGWGWLHNKGDYLPVQDAWGPVVGWGWWHRVQSSSLVSDDGRKTQVSVWSTPVWLCWPYCKRNTQLKQTSWGSCVADTDIIHVTILNKKQIRSILLARIVSCQRELMHTFTWFNAFTLPQSDALITAQFSQVRERSLLFRSSKMQTNIKGVKRMLPSWRICMVHCYKTYHIKSR